MGLSYRSLFFLLFSIEVRSCFPHTNTFVLVPFGIGLSGLPFGYIKGTICADIE